MRGIFAFEDIDDSLPLLPLAARRALDAAGKRLSLSAWQALSQKTRAQIVELGITHEIDTDGIVACVASAEPPCVELDPANEADLDTRPPQLESSMSTERWQELSRLERFALRHLVKRNNPRRLQQALAEIAPKQPTHLDAKGNANMVDVGAKATTHRRAVVRARVRMRPETMKLMHGGASKGDVLAAARIAGIMGAKKTSELIPLCHPIHLDRVRIAFEMRETSGEIDVIATADAHDKTGVEMEAMTAATVAALTIYDMLKGVERGIVIEQVVLLEKIGGRSGHYKRNPREEPSS